MTPEQFVLRAVGVGWKRWRSDWQAMDCFGVVVLAHLEVLGIDVGPVPQTDIVTGFAEARPWQECGPEPGSTGFMSWRDGAPTHCGMLMLPGILLHSQEGFPIPEHGSVRTTRLEVMRRMCQDLRFYRYAPC